MPLGQVVPELFQANSGVDLSVRAKQSDHFAEHGETQISSSRRLVGSKKDSVQNLGKAMLIGLIFDHERRESLGRIQREISSLLDCKVQVHSLLRQASVQPLTMLLGC